MNKPSFTPGPWSYEEDGGFVFLPVKDAEGHRCGVLQTSGELKAKFEMSDYYWSGHHEEVRANARLIASAPALYAALEAMIEAADGVCDCGECGGCQRTAHARNVLNIASGNTEVSP